jgi:hypothetical protein
VIEAHNKIFTRLTKIELKEVVMALPKDKAPQQDGVSSEFF